MREEAKDWRGALDALLDEVRTAYGDLREGALDLRRALLRGPLADVQARVEEHRARLTHLSRLTRQAQTLCHDHGLVPADADFTLRRLAAAECVRSDERHSTSVLVSCSIWFERLCTFAWSGAKSWT